MHGKDVGTTSAVQREQTKPRARTRSGTGLFQCLVASVDPKRRDALASAASGQGWNPVVCADAQNANAASRRMLLGLALVDLEKPGGGTPSQFRPLTEQLVVWPNLLVVVCGHQEDPTEEIWARRLGAWLYLPGFRHDTEVATVCREAMIVSQRLTMPAGERPILRPFRKEGGISG